MIRYIKGLRSLWKIRFRINECQNMYFLQHALSIFLQAEGKELKVSDDQITVTAMPMARRLIVSRLPQFSEEIYKQISSIKALHDSKLSRVRVLKSKSRDPAERISFDELGHEKDSFLKQNHALLLTYPGKIPGLDCVDD